MNTIGNFHDVLQNKLNPKKIFVTDEGSRFSLKRCLVPFVSFDNKNNAKKQSQILNLYAIDHK